MLSLVPNTKIVGDFTPPKPTEYGCAYCDFKHRSVHLVVNHTIEMHPEKTPGQT